MAAVQKAPAVSKTQPKTQTPSTAQGQAARPDGKKAAGDVQAVRFDKALKDNAPSVASSATPAPRRAEDLDVAAAGKTAAGDRNALAAAQEKYAAAEGVPIALTDEDRTKNAFAKNLAERELNLATANATKNIDLMLDKITAKADGQLAKDGVLFKPEATFKNPLKDVLAASGGNDPQDKSGYAGLVETRIANRSEEGLARRIADASAANQQGDTDSVERIQNGSTELMRAELERSGTNPGPGGNVVDLQRVDVANLRARLDKNPIIATARTDANNNRGTTAVNSDNAANELNVAPYRTNWKGDAIPTILMNNTPEL